MLVPSIEFLKAQVQELSLKIFRGKGVVKSRGKPSLLVLIWMLASVQVLAACHNCYSRNKVSALFVASRIMIYCSHRILPDYNLWLRRH